MTAPQTSSRCDTATVRRALLDWYAVHRRDLPWRAPPGERADPYRVWISEIMCQQTTVPAVKPYFAAFMRRWPTVERLAAADVADVLHAWQGLGYYARARNLHACARAVVERHGGRFPEDAAGLRTLPGVGAYTAAAIAAIAFDRPEMPVDANVARVTARLFALPHPLPAGLPRIAAEAARFADRERPGDLAQAFMDLGAGICTPREPRCMLCPLAAHCAARALGIAASLPAKAARTPRPIRHGVAFWIERDDGAVLLRRRPPKGLLGGLMEIPSTPWRELPWSGREAEAHAPVLCSWRPLAGGVGHTFTHFHLELAVWAGAVATGCNAPGTWVLPDAWGDQALPTLMRKVARLARAGG